MEAEVVNITKIKDGYFLGDEATAVNLDVILQFKITHMINAAGPQVQNSWESIGIKYLTLNWSESPNQSLFDPKDEVANRIVGFIDDSSKNGEGFLVHSLKGQNRACIVVLIYLVKKFRWSLKKCLDFLSSKKQDVNIPNYFLSQLNAFEARLCKIGQGPKTSNWNEISTGNLSDIDNEELLIRNTYLNSLIANSVNEIISYSYKENRSNKKVNWTDQKGKNLVVPNIKKDLALMNPKEIKQLVYNKNIKPNKGCLKQNNTKNESNYISKSFINEKVEKNEIINMSLNKNNQSFKENSKDIRIGNDDKTDFNNDQYNSYFNKYQKNVKDKSEEVFYHQNNHNSNSSHAFIRENSIKKKEFNNKENSLKNDVNLSNYRPNTSDNLNRLGIDIGTKNNLNQNNFEKEDKLYFNNYNNNNPQLSGNKLNLNRPNSGKNEKYDMKNDSVKQNNISITNIRPQSVDNKNRKPPFQEDNKKQFVPVQNIVNNNINNIYIQHEDIKKLIYQEPNKVQENLVNNKFVNNSDKNNQSNVFNKNNISYNNPNYNVNNINTLNINNLNISNKENESSIKRNPNMINQNQIQNQNQNQNISYGIQNSNNVNNNNSKINKNSFNVQNKLVKNSENQNINQTNMYYNQGKILDNMNNRINEKRDEGRGYYDEYDNSNFKTAYFNINDFKPINNSTNNDKNRYVKNDKNEKEKDNNRSKYVR